MLVTAIIGHDHGTETTKLINSILSFAGKGTQILNFDFFKSLSIQDIILYINNLNDLGTDILIVKINIKNLDLKIFSKINFDIVIYECKPYIKGEKDEELLKNSFLKLSPQSMAIVNFDDENISRVISQLQNRIITYGFNSKSSITTSSIGENIIKEDFMLCLQKTIMTKSGDKIEPQEYLIHMDTEKVDPYNILAAASFAIASGVDLNRLNSI